MQKMALGSVHKYLGGGGWKIWWGGQKVLMLQKGGGSKKFLTSKKGGLKKFQTPKRGGIKKVRTFIDFQNFPGSSPRTPF